jgi:hypothetical protein
MDTSSSSAIDRLFEVRNALKPYLQYLVTRSLDEQLYILTHAALISGLCEEIRYEHHRPNNELEKFRLKLFEIRNLSPMQRSFFVTIDRSGTFNVAILQLPENGSQTARVQFHSLDDDVFRVMLEREPGLLSRLPELLRETSEVLGQHIYQIVNAANDRNYRFALLAGKIPAICNG